MQPAFAVRAGRDEGYSLIELVVVIAIAGALLGFSYPRLATLVTKYRLDGAAWNLMTDLQKVRLRAIAEGARFKVAFDDSARTYTVQKEVAGSFQNQGQALALEDSGMIQLTTTANPVFTTRGTLENACVARLQIPTGTGVRMIGAQVGGRIYVQ